MRRFNLKKLNEAECIGHYHVEVSNTFAALDQRKQAKVQWLQDPSKINEDNLKDKINELAKNSKNKKIRDLYRGIN
jgi:hypothetical protein